MKKWTHFFAGMLVMATIIAMSGTAFAAAEKFQISEAGIMINYDVKVKPGESYTASDGQTLPAVLTYTDSAGKTANYLPIPMLYDLLDLEITWSDERNSVIFGHTMDDADVQVTFYPGGKVSSENPSSPVLGTTVGPFTEIDPRVVDRTQYSVGIVEDATRVQSATGFWLEGIFLANDGKYAVMEITNNGTTPVTSQAGRVRTMGTIDSKKFTNVDIAPGETLTRAFSIAENAELYKSFMFCGVRGADPTDEIDVTVSFKQYK